MNVLQLRDMTLKLIEEGHGDADVAVDLNTFFEGDDGETIAQVFQEDSRIEEVKCINPDDRKDVHTLKYFVLRGL